MTKSLGELTPLVPATTGTDETNTAGAVEKKEYYDSAIEEVSSQQKLKKKRLLKVTHAICILVVFIVIFKCLKVGNKATDDAADAAGASLLASIKADHLFAGLLADEKAFYFPTKANSVTADPPQRRRFLRSLTTTTDDDSAASPPAIDWSFKQSANDAAAIGEYYRAKGMALANYYRAKYDPTFNKGEAANNNDGDDDSIMDAWTDDWKADRARGIALGQKYEAIGKAIDEHYRKAFNHTDIGESRTNEEYDWKQDRDLGKAIGDQYKELGKHIADHYNQDVFNDITNDNTTDWSEKWKLYKKKGQEIADYYKSKGDAIDEFYKGKYSLEGMNRPELEAAVALNDQHNNAGDTTVTAANTNFDNNSEGRNDNDEPYVWGLDWRKDRDHAIAVRHGLMKKGMSINDYYRAKYDPTYNNAPHPTPIPSNEKAATSTTTNTADDDDSSSIVPHNPDVDFPPWGVDPDADRQHGIAIGEYWKKMHELQRKHYKQVGDDLGNYYENFYRSKFDPTYKNYGK